MNNKGNMFDVFPIIFIIVVVGILLLVGLVFTSKINTAIQNISSLPGNPASYTQTIDSQASWTFDFLFITILFCLPLASMILAFFNNIHPFFFWASIGIMMLAIILGAAFGDAWSSIVSTGDLATSASRLPMTNFVMSNFGIYAFFCILIIAVGIFVKTKSDTGGYF